MLLFTLASANNKPIVFVPPMMGSVLYGNVTNLGTHWYCHKSLDQTWLWLTERYALPPVISCLAQYLTIVFNETTQKSQSRPESSIYTIDFGGDKAIRYLDKGLFGKHIIPLLDDVLDRFSKGGYVIREDMYGAPYDWRFNPSNMGTYWLDLKHLVEEAYEHNGKTPVTLFGFSAGCMAGHLFLTTKVDEKWKKQYIRAALWVGPSYPGSTEAAEILWAQKIVFLPGVFNTKDVNKFVTTVPTLYGHLPNTAVYGDRTIFEGPNGDKYTAKDLYDFYNAHGKVAAENVGIFKENLPFIDRQIVDPEVDVYFIFNTGVSTIESFKFPNGFDKDYVTTNTSGDGTIAAHGFYYGCNNWVSNRARICHDVHVFDDDFNHVGEVSQPEVCDLIFEAATKDDWLTHKGSHNITGFGTDSWKDLH